MRSGLAEASGAIIGALGTFLILGLAAPVAASGLEWDQQKAIDLTVKINQELDLALAAAKHAPDQDTVLQQRSRDATIRQVERLRERSGELLKKLRSGWGREETVTYYELAREQAHEVLVTAQGVVPRKDPIGHWRAARKHAQELGRYYKGAY